MPASPERLVVGHLNKAHGTKGEVFVWPLTERPAETFVVGRAFDLGQGDTGTEPTGRPAMEIEEVRAYRRGFLVRFRGVVERNAAEALRGFYLLSPVDELPAREEGEYFYHELLGMIVSTEDGQAVGVVTEVFPLEPNHMLQVTDGEKVRLIPFATRILREVDVEGGRIVIDPPVGLLDL